jgi:DNA helicase IV
MQRGSAGATGDFENVMLRSKIKLRNEPIVFLYRSPTVLANVLAESLLTDRLKDLFGEMAVRVVKEINAFCHGEGPPIG